MYPHGHRAVTAGQPETYSRAVALRVHTEKDLVPITWIRRENP